MGVNKVVVNDEVKLDLTEDTVAPDNLLSGVTAHDKSGNKISGTLDLTALDKAVLYVPGLPSSANWQSVCCNGNDTFVAIARGSNKAAFSEIGKAWTATTLPSAANWSSVCCEFNYFVAVAYNSNKAAISLNGQTWTAATLPSSATWRSVCYGGDTFVAIAYNSNEAAYSTDKGQTWTAATLPSAANWNSVCCGNDTFVTVAYNSNKAAYSTDEGRTWTAVTLPSSATWQSVCYGGDTFVAIAYNSNKGAYSTDRGRTWTAVTLPSSATWQSVCYGGGTFVTVAYNSNKAAYSTDKGQTWTAVTLPSYNYWTAACFSNNSTRVVAISENGVVAYSVNKGVTWRRDQNVTDKSGTDISYELREVLAVPAASTSGPKMDATSAAIGTSSSYARGDHVHPTDTSRQAKITASGILKGDGTNISAAEAGVDYAAPEAVAAVEAKVTAVEAAVAGKLDKSGGEMTGPLSIRDNLQFGQESEGLIYLDSNDRIALVLFCESTMEIGANRLHLLATNECSLNGDPVAVQPKATHVTLTAAGWSNKMQTVGVDGVLADETKQLIQPMPASASASAYYEAGVYCSGQGGGAVTFTCSTVPTENLSVYVVTQTVN